MRELTFLLRFTLVASENDSPRCSTFFVVIVLNVARVDLRPAGCEVLATAAVVSGGVLASQNSSK